MGKAGRRIVLQHMSLERYVERLSAIVHEELAEAEGGATRMLNVK
jgi:ribosomal protein L17